MSAAGTTLLFTQGFISGFALIPPWAMKSVALKGSFATTPEAMFE